jgi:hypothetical protein
MLSLSDRVAHEEFMSMLRSSYSGTQRLVALAAAVGWLGTLAIAGCASSGAPSVAQRTATTAPTAPPQSVTITTDHARYRSAEVIGVVVQNVTGAPLYATEQYSACTMLQLQMRVNGKWETVQPCIGGQQPQVRTLAPKVAFPLSFGPGNSTDNPNLWRTGTYRFVLLYGTKADGSNATSSCYSAGFEVTG